MKVTSAENFKIIVVTDLESCKDYFPDRLVLLANSGADAVILRAKSLSPQDYQYLASIASTIFDDRIRPCLICHTYMEGAYQTGIDKLHLPMPILLKLSKEWEEKLSKFRKVGASVHSTEEAVRAVSLGADYVIFGNVYETGSKPGLPPRGLAQLSAVVDAVSMPVYAIGGINVSNIKDIRLAGARGACLMSGYMECEDPRALTEDLRSALI